MFEHLVFVYGTLKRGEPNHYLLQPESKSGQSIFVGTGCTEKKFPLVVATAYNIPHLLDVPGSGSKVSGEIFSVDQSMLNILDELEGIPKHYQRRRENIVLKDCSISEKDLALESDKHSFHSGGTLSCWIYVCGGFKEELLNLPYLAKFSSQATRYIPRFVL